jgi:hypothetical protein
MVDIVNLQLEILSCGRKPDGQVFNHKLQITNITNYKFAGAGTTKYGAVILRDNVSVDKPSYLP